jgi:hypothetical protein
LAESAWPTSQSRHAVVGSTRVHHQLDPPFNSRSCLTWPTQFWPRCGFELEAREQEIPTCGTPHWLEGFPSGQQGTGCTLSIGRGTVPCQLEGNWTGTQVQMNDLYSMIKVILSQQDETDKWKSVTQQGIWQEAVYKLSWQSFLRYDSPRGPHAFLFFAGRIKLIGSEKCIKC